jgi:hypothetical protein
MKIVEKEESLLKNKLKVEFEDIRIDEDDLKEPLEINPKKHPFLYKIDFK